VNAAPIETAVLGAVTAAGKLTTFAEIREILKAGGTEWSEKNIEKAIVKLVSATRLITEEAPNPKNGIGQKKTRRAYRIS
jgi:hypothetical protein